ncbi:MAG TPA: DNA polymerase ligase N-terminal domain-containing protein [Methanocella sp.]|nr:DNA polymerase ligase N-terminal domain-containing protein [Methanocella sp.]
MPPEGPLGTYREKRQFTRTPEPQGREEPQREQPIFVIQKHDASHLHYDFRLEWGGALKSWAVPKGPSTTPRTMRLAMLTEDHPIDYARFEGVIPEGNYGAGTVMVWDTGTYRNLRAEKPDRPEDMEQSFQEGKIEVWLEGKKLKGGYALIRTKGMGGGDEADRKWLLVKMKDEFAGKPADPEKNQPDSALTGRTMEEIRRDAEEAARAYAAGTPAR